MEFADYIWRDYDEGDPEVSGPPDRTRFDAKDGGQVLYLVNALMAIWNLKSKQSCLKLERMMRHIPKNISRQDSVMEWLRRNWERY